MNRCDSWPLKLDVLSTYSRNSKTMHNDWIYDCNLVLSWCTPGLVCLSTAENCIYQKLKMSYFMRTVWSYNNQYIEYPSCHPLSCKKGIPFSQAKRYIRIISDDGNFEKELDKPQELEVLSLNYPYSLKTKSSQCHYVIMTRSETKF